MELLYNPEQMADEELKATFVGREALVEELLSLIEHQSGGPGVQHAVIIASRGMGKTTVLLMVRLGLQESGLDDRWLPLKFPEESWGITDTADLWCETLVRIAAATGEAELGRNAVALKESAGPGGDVADAALAEIRDWARRSGKRLLLMIENLDQLFEQFSDEQELARLRDVLMNDGRIMLLGSATSFFHEARGYEQPLYNFFKIYNLNDLELGEIKSLLSRRAERDGIANFDEKLAAETQRLKALRHFTGGNPRLVLMLYRVITLTEIGDVQRALEKLLDEITPYYQGKTQSLPPQQRKILDHLARTASERHEGLTPQEIAEGTRLSPNQVSAQLRRLAESGYVAAAALRGRNTYYSLSEPLYSVWYQMRFGRDSRRRFGWLLTFLKLWYSVEEILQAGNLLDMRFVECLQDGLTDQARKHLEIRGYLAEALGESDSISSVWDPVVRGHLQLDDVGWLHQNLSRKRIVRALLPGTLAALRARGFAPVMSDDPVGGQDESPRLSESLEAAQSLFARAISMHQEGHSEEAVIALDQVVERFREVLPSAVAWVLLAKASMLGEIDTNEKEVAVYDQIVGRFAGVDEESRRSAMAWALVAKGKALFRMGRYLEAVAAYDQVVERFTEARETKLREKVAEALVAKSATLLLMGQSAEAVAACDLVIERFGKLDEPTVRERVGQALLAKGRALVKLDRHEQAIAALDIVINQFGSANNSALRDLAVWAHVSKLHPSARMGDAGGIRFAWRALRRITTAANDDTYFRPLLAALCFVAREGNTEVAREIITESILDERLFPLTRALDYVISGNPEHIEKLPPELRSVVAEIVQSLPKPTQQRSAKAAAPKSKKPKRRASSRSRRKLS